MILISMAYQMCGIAEFIGRAMPKVPVELLTAIIDKIRHRRPDDAGFFSAESGSWTTGFAHRRLSFVDLASAHQPLGNEDDCAQGVFNGEVYDYQGLRHELTSRGHRFVTIDDSECVVYANEQLGTDCVGQFRGMFAFAIWDARLGHRFLTRELFGKKPQILCENKGTRWFASEITIALARQGAARELTTESAWKYFTYRYVPDRDANRKPCVLPGSCKSLRPST